MQELQAKLKKLRLEKGLSLEDVQKKTRIHLNILKAIEGDGLTDLSPVYLKSFLKIYCRFLGVSEEECSLQQKQQPRKETAQEKPAPQVKAVLKKVTEKFADRAPAIELKKILTVLVIAVLFVLVIFAFSRMFGAWRKAALVKKEMTAVTVVKKQEKKLPAPKAKPRAAAAVVKAAEKPALPAPAGKESSSGIRLGIRAKEDCFIVLKADGKVVFQRTLGKGRYENWRALNKIELSVGDAAAVELEVNGQLFQKIGRKRQAIKNILITKDGMVIPNGR